MCLAAPKQPTYSNTSKDSVPTLPPLTPLQTAADVIDQQQQAGDSQYSGLRGLAKVLTIKQHGGTA